LGARIRKKGANRSGRGKGGQGAVLHIGKRETKTVTSKKKRRVFLRKRELTEKKVQFKAQKRSNPQKKKKNKAPYFRKVDLD